MEVAMNRADLVMSESRERIRNLAQPDRSRWPPSPKHCPPLGEERPPDESMVSGWWSRARRAS